MTECQEVAETFPIENVKTFDDAVRVVTIKMGTPSEVGHQIHDNIAEALYRRAKRANAAKA